MQSLFKFLYSAFQDVIDLKGELTDFARGSINLIPLGVRQWRPFKNFSSAGVGSRMMFQIKDTHGGLDDVSGQEAHGSLFTSIADALIYIGTGQVIVAGVVLAGAIATSLLRMTLKYNGSYTDPGSATYTVGLNQPSTPTVGPLTTTIGGTPQTNGTYSFRVARLREVTGGKSRASGVTAVLSLVGKAAYVVVPLASAGQTRWIFFVTEKGLGGIGLHFRLPTANPYTGTEYYESEIERTETTLSVTNASAVVTASSPIFTVQDVGKRFAPVSGGFSVPDPTTVASVDSSIQVTLNHPVTVTSGANPRSAKFIAYIANIDRSIILNWLESDLAGEAAELDWIYDYPPPAGSHAFQLESRLAVVTMADSKLEASGSNAGTAIVFSLTNQLESFDLRFPLYFPGQFVDVIGRGIDSYSFIGLRNGIYCLQYINSDTIPATVSVLLPTEGIYNRRNWCITGRGLYICTGKGTVVKIGENGSVDRLFYEPIRRFIRAWAQETTVIINQPLGGVLVANGDEGFYFDEQTERWSTLLDLSDTAPGNVIAGVGAASEMYVSIESGSTRTLYKFDGGSGSYVVGVSPFKNAPEEMAMFIQKIQAEMLADRTDKSAYLAIHKNNQPAYVSDAAITATTNLLTSVNAQFTAEHLGGVVLIKGSGAGGAWQTAKIKQVVSATQIRLGTITEALADSANQNAVTTVASAYMLIAHRIFPIKANKTGVLQVQSPELYLNGFSSIATSIFLQTTGDEAQPINVEIFGNVTAEKWDYTNSTWGTEA